MTPDEISDYIGRRWEEAREASGKAALGVLLLLAMDAREQYPNATGIRIGSSDQGDFMDCEAVLDADGNVLDNDGDTYFDEDALAWGLDDSNKHAWEPYANPTERHHHRNRQYVIDINKVLTEVTLPTKEDT